MRKNENENDLHGNSAQGIGAIASFLDNVISFSAISEFVSVGDKLFQVNGSSNELIGTIQEINGNSVSLSSVINTPFVGMYCFSKKDSRIEGGEVRGYYLEVELTNNSDKRVELFAVNTNAIKSYV